MALKRYYAQEARYSYTRAGLKNMKDIFKTWCANQNLEGSDELEYVFGTEADESYTITVEQQIQDFDEELKQFK